MRQFWLPLCFALSLSQAALPPRFTQLGWGDGGDVFDDGDVDEEGKGRSLHAALHPPKVVAEVISVGGAAVNWCTKDQQKTLWECGEKAGYDQAARCKCCDISCTLTPCTRMKASGACKNGGSGTAPPVAEAGAPNGRVDNGY